MTTRALLLLALLLLLVGLPSTAETYKIVLHNGNTFESRYEPVDASFDPTQVTFLTNMGNQIAVPKADIKSIAPETENKGFGYRLDTTTVAVGWAPNDNPTPWEMRRAAETETQAAALASLLGLPTEPPPPPYTAPLVSEPNAGGGLPFSFTGQTTPPLSGGAIGAEPVTRSF